MTSLKLVFISTLVRNLHNLQDAQTSSKARRSLFREPIRSQEIVGCTIKSSFLVFAFWIVGCDPTASGFDTLHPRSTADCTRHIDGSSYAIDGHGLGDNDVSADIHQQGHAAPFMELVYFVVDGDTLRLDSRQFTAAGPSGETIAIAKAALWLNPLVQGSDPELGDLPAEFRGDGSVRGRDGFPEQKKTIYRVVLTFDQALPEQFDLHAPQVWLKGTRYPIRVFGFRNFPNRGLGLCE